MVAVKWYPSETMMKNPCIQFYDGPRTIEINYKDIPALIEWLKEVSE
jgi:hypothetical protein